MKKIKPTWAFVLGVVCGVVGLGMLLTAMSFVGENRVDARKVVADPYAYAGGWPG